MGTFIEQGLWVRMANAGASPTARSLLPMMMASANVSQVGVAPLTATRWADLIGSDAAAVDAALDELDRLDFVVLDRSTDEVWLADYMRFNDRFYVRPANHQNLVRTTVLSSRIREHALARR